MGYDYAVLPFTLHGPYWRNMRKVGQVVGFRRPNCVHEASLEGYG
nr:cytochrome P450 82C4-like [Ipomoea batatas]